MNKNPDAVTRARARTAFIAAAALAVAAWPVASQAQNVLPVPTPAIQVPAVQVPAIQVPPPRSLMDERRLDMARQALDALAPTLDVVRLDAMKALDLARLDLSLAQLDAPQGRVVVQPTPNVRLYYDAYTTGSYEAGLSALDSEQWQRAIDRFDQVIKANKTRVDGAMYWKAYALDKLGQRSDALATLEALGKTYPNSRYLDDAKALDIEVRKRAGQSVKPEDQANEDLKLIALTSVMQADPERGIPLLQQIIKGNNSLKIKQRALFLLSTSDSTQARDVLAGIAKGGANPDLQLRAIRYLGTRGRANNTQLLGEIYAASKDTDVKREIIRSLMMARDVDQLLNIAKTEPSAELRIEAIRGLGSMRATGDIYERLAGLYTTEKAGEIREQILRSMLASGNAQRAADLAKQETDAKVRASAVRSLGMADSAKTGDSLVQIYKTDKDQGVKKAVVSALYMQQNAKALVDLARQESDPTMKKEIVSRLSTMKAKEATDYMLELLK
jgi:tetratricopeptide (TPR) repeat protein